MFFGYPGTDIKETPSKLRVNKNILKSIIKTSVVDPKLLVPDLDPTFQKVTDPDPTFKKVSDPVSDPTLNIYFFSRTIILRSLNSILKHNFGRILKICIL
jgi:hypothetical protein